MKEQQAVSASPLGTIPRGISKRHTLRDTALVFGATIVVNGANFGFHLGAVRLLGLQPYSALAALLAVYLIFSVPANVLQAIITSLIGESLSVEPHRAATLTHTVVRVGGIAAGAIALIGLVAAPAVAKYLAIADPIAVYLSFIAIALGFAVAALRGVLQGQQRFGRFAASLMFEAGGNLIFGLGLVVLFRDVRAAVLGNVCAIASALAFSFASVWVGRSVQKLELDLKRMVEKSIGTLLGLGAIAAMSWLDVILVRHLAPGPFAGLYGAMSIVGKTILFSVSFVPLVLLAKASKLKGENEPTRPLLLVMLAIGAGFCLIELSAIQLAPGVILRTIAGNDAVAAAPYLFGYSVALAALAMTTIVVNYGIGTHRFAFVIPLALVELGEIVAINLHHAKITDVIAVVIVGHTTALIITTLVVFASGRSSLRGFLFPRRTNF